MPIHSPHTITSQKDTKGPHGHGGLTVRLETFVTGNPSTVLLRVLCKLAAVL